MKKKKFSSKKLILIIAAIVLLLGVVISAVFLIKNTASNKDDSYLSTQDIEDKHSVEVSFKQLMSSADYQEKTEKDKINSIETLLSELETEELIQKDSVNYNETAKVFHFKYACGIPGAILIEEEETYSNQWLNSISFTESISEKTINLSKTPKSTNDNDCPVDSVFMYGFDNKNDVERSLGDWTEMCNSKLTIKTKIIDCPTVSDFKTALLDNEYICILEHGNYGDIVPDTYVFQVMGEEVTTDTDSDYIDDLSYGYIVPYTDAKGETFYCITPKFFEHYYKNKLTGSIVYLISCQGFGDEDTLTYGIGDTLTKQCGVKVVVGFNETVAQNYAYNIYDIITDLLLKGYTIGDAYQSAIDELGATDYEFLVDRLDEVTDVFERIEWAKAINKKKATNGASFLIYGIKTTTLMPSYTVNGLVNDSETGNPISNVKIEVINNNIYSDEPIEIVTTDANGAFSFNLPPSSYSLSFHHNDYEYYGTSLTVDDTNQTFSDPILLTPKDNKTDTPSSNEDELKAIAESYGIASIWEYADYDGNGTKEAFAVITNESSVALKTLYVSSDGTVTIMEDNLNLMFSPSVDGNIKFTEGKGFFYADMMPGNYYSTVLYSVKNNVPYVLNLSGDIEGFAQSGDVFYTYEVTFASGGRGYDTRELIYNPSTQEFTKGDIIEIEDAF